MQSWLKSFLVPTDRARRVDGRTCEQDFHLSTWHPDRTALGSQGHPIR
ncbi:hypothetical protein [Mobilicoccus caccae]|nr:hypothetical protein [Mobilicoccus caccae]